jgi:all-trans-retinol 13,14-reductase
MAKNKSKKGLIVIGGGLTGLSTALTWALNHNIKKEPVLLIEKEPKTGGFVTSYKRQDYLFDTCQMIPNIWEILKYLGITIDLKKFKGYYMRIFLVDSGRVKKIELPSGFEHFKNKLKQNYSHEAGKIEKFLDYSRAMFLELFNLKLEPSFLDIIKILFTSPKIVKNSSSTFKKYFSKFKIRDPEVVNIFDVFAAFSALPSEKVSALVPVSAMNSLLDGAFRPQKGFIEFPKKLEERYLNLGGELKLNTKVKKILLDRDRVQGVLLEDGEEINSDYVVTTIDPKVAMINMVGIENLLKLDKKFARKVQSVKMSTSSINLSIGLDHKIDLAALGLDCGYNVITTGGDSFNRLYESFERGEIGFKEDLFHFGVVCPSLTTGGKPNITIRVVPIPIGNWTTIREKDLKRYEKEKQYWADFFIDKTEKYVIPALSRHIKVLDISTPATYARYSGSPTGSIYDMAPYPDNFGRNRLKMRTPVKGLFQPKFVHGVFGALLAGMQVNDMILGGKIMGGKARYKL